MSSATTVGVTDSNSSRNSVIQPSFEEEGVVETDEQKNMHTISALPLPSLLSSTTIDNPDTTLSHNINSNEMGSINEVDTAAAVVAAIGLGRADNDAADGDHDHDDDDDGNGEMEQATAASGSGVISSQVTASGERVIRRRVATRYVLESEQFIRLDPKVIPPELLKELAKFDVNEDGNIDQHELLLLLKKHRQQRFQQRRLYETVGLVLIGCIILLFTVFGICYWAVKVAQNVNVQSNGAHTLSDNNKNPVYVSSNSYAVNSKTASASFVSLGSSDHFADHRVHTSLLSIDVIRHMPAHQRKMLLQDRDAAGQSPLFTVPVTVVNQWYDVSQNNPSSTTLTVQNGATTLSLTFQITSITSYVNSTTVYRGIYTTAGRSYTTTVLCLTGVDSCAVWQYHSYVANASIAVNDAHLPLLSHSFQKLDECNERDACSSLNASACSLYSSSCYQHGAACYSRCDAIADSSHCHCRSDCVWQSSSSSSSSSSSQHGRCEMNVCTAVRRRLRCLEDDHGHFKCDCTKMNKNETSCAFNCGWDELSNKPVFAVRSPSSFSLSSSSSSSSSSSITSSSSSVTPLSAPSSVCLTKFSMQTTCVSSSGSAQTCYTCANIPQAYCDNTCWWQNTDSSYSFCSSFATGRCSACFPGDARVQVRLDHDANVNFNTSFSASASSSSSSSSSSSTFRPIREVVKGDVVASVDDQGKKVWTRVLHVPHSFNNRPAAYIHLYYNDKESEQEGVFRLTGSHLLYVVRVGEEEKGKQLVKASTVNMNDWLLHSQFGAVRVTRVSVQRSSEGVYTLYTANTRVIVDGVVASGFADNGAMSVDYQVYKWSTMLFGEAMAEQITAYFVEFVTESVVGQIGRQMFHSSVVQASLPALFHLLS